jgi:hypothetical protein
MRAAVLTIGFLAPESVVRAQGAIAPTALTATATMTGRLFADSVQVPLGEAQVSILNLNLTTRSNSEGRFTLRGIPVGAHRLEVRSVGYEPYLTVMTLRTPQDFEMDIVMQRTGHILQTFVVEGSIQSKRLKEFEQNRRWGFGTFITQDRLQKMPQPLLGSALIGKLPGGLIITRLGQTVVMSRRSRDCFAQVIINGMQMYGARDKEPPFDLNSLQSYDVIGVEHYTAAQTPARYTTTGAASCGTLVIYTR